MGLIGSNKDGNKPPQQPTDAAAFSKSSLRRTSHTKRPVRRAVSDPQITHSADTKQRHLVKNAQNGAPPAQDTLHRQQAPQNRRRATTSDLDASGRKRSPSPVFDTILQCANLFLANRDVHSQHRSMARLTPQMQARQAGSASAQRLPYPNLATLIDKYGGPSRSHEIVCTLAAHIITHDARFSANDPAFAIIMAESRPSGASVEELKALNQIKSNLTQDLVGLKTRDRQTLSLGFPNVTSIFRQTFGHISTTRHGLLRYEPDQTLSSDAIKKEMEEHNSFMRQNNANLAAVHGPDGLLLVRSARTDTAKRLEELLIFGALNAGPSDVPYRAAIISALDQSRKKEFSARASGGEVETVFLEAQKAAVDELFGDQQIIERTMDDGRTIALQRPLLFNLVMSGQAYDAKNIDLTRAYNTPAMQSLLPMFAARLGDSPAARALFESLSTALTPEAQRNVLSDPRLVALLSNPDGRLPAQERLALTALKLGITGTDFEGNSYTKPEDPGLELVLINHLLRACGVTPHAQCKSGEDRTLAISSMVIAADDFSRREGRPFNPAEMRTNPAVHKSMQVTFTQAADTFGLAPIQDVRSVEKGSVKWGIKGDGKAGHPFAGYMYLPENSPLIPKPID